MVAPQTHTILSMAWLRIISDAPFLALELGGVSMDVAEPGVRPDMVRTGAGNLSFLLEVAITLDAELLGLFRIAGEGLQELGSVGPPMIVLVLGLVLGLGLSWVACGLVWLDIYFWCLTEPACLIGLVVIFPPHGHRLSAKDCG